MIENRGIVVIFGIKSIVFPSVVEIPKCSNMRIYIYIYIYISAKIKNQMVITVNQQIVV